MASVLHGSARTTPRVRAELQASKESTRTLAARYGVNPKTVAKWKKRTSTVDAPMGPRVPHSTVLTEVEESMIVEFRRRTLLPLDDVLGGLREAIPKLTRSALHRCLQRYGISRLPGSEEKGVKRGRFAETKIGYVHIDSSELRLTEGKLHMFLAIDRVSKLTYVEFHQTADTSTGPAFLRGVVAAFPYRIRIVLTDNGVPFADLPKNRDMVCATALVGSNSIGSPGLAYVKWENAVRPGDELRLRIDVIETRVAQSRPDLGMVRWRWRMFNQREHPVLDLEATSLFDMIHT
jgi:hypothetical protein